jgi:AbrB family looped-hinge helix DNA binding protein
MKQSTSARIHKKMTRNDKFYGLTTLGARGQVVIPAEARKDLKLKAGDQMLVIGKFGKALGLIKAEELEDLAKVIMRNFEGSHMEGDIRAHISKMFGKAFSKSTR